MKNKTVRLSVVAVVAVLSVFGLSQAPAAAAKGDRHHHQSFRTGDWCC